MERVGSLLSVALARLHPRKSTERQVVIRYLMGWNGAVKGPASSVHRHRQHLVLLGTQLNYNFN